MMKMKCLCTALLIGLLVSPASAGLIVDGADGTYAVDSFFDVYFEVTVPAGDALVGWALDVSWDETYLEFQSYTIGGDWDEGAAQPDDPDVLDLGALAFVPFVEGTSIMFGINFKGLLETPDTLVEVSWQEVELEGFVYESGPFAAVDMNTPAHIELVPEPATLSLLAFGALALIRRR